MRKATADSFTLMGQIKGFGFLLIFYAIVALILAAILKKRDKSLDF
jgi:ABC-type multidrug transport system permease subunit